MKHIPHRWPAPYTEREQIIGQAESTRDKDKQTDRRTYRKCGVGWDGLGWGGVGEGEGEASVSMVDHFVKTKTAVFPLWFLLYTCLLNVQLGYSYCMYRTGMDITAHVQILITTLILCLAYTAGIDPKPLNSMWLYYVNSYRYDPHDQCTYDSHQTFV